MVNKIEITREGEGKEKRERVIFGKTEDLSHYERFSNLSQLRERGNSPGSGPRLRLLRNAPRVHTIMLLSTCHHPASS